MTTRNRMTNRQAYEVYKWIEDHQDIASTLPMAELSKLCSESTSIDVNQKTMIRKLTEAGIQRTYREPRKDKGKPSQEVMDALGDIAKHLEVSTNLMREFTDLAEQLDSMIEATNQHSKRISNLEVLVSRFTDRALAQLNRSVAA